MTRRALAVAAVGATLGASPWLAPAAWAAFATAVSASASFGAYAVPAPANLRCQGLTSLTSSRVVWDAVTPPAGDAVVYVVTPPSGRATTTSATFYQLPAISPLTGQYRVQAQISSGWQSQPATITVTLSVLVLYVCTTP
jgi:hypothetical protein